MLWNSITEGFDLSLFASLLGMYDLRSVNFVVLPRFVLTGVNNCNSCLTIVSGIVMRIK